MTKAKRHLPELIHCLFDGNKIIDFQNVSRYDQTCFQSINVELRMIYSEWEIYKILLLKYASFFYLLYFFFQEATQSNDKHRQSSKCLRTESFNYFCSLLQIYVSFIRKNILHFTYVSVFLFLQL